jgi:thioredoxin-dependent peroxiredoxin
VLKAGDKAPAFNLESDEGGKVGLSDFADKTLVLYFYPRDNTPGCTREAQAFTQARQAIEKAGGAVIGVSRDSLKSHQSFREKCGLGITLLSDPDLAVHRAYGAWGTKTMYGKQVEGVLRSTFLVKAGKIARVFPSVKVDGHADAVLTAIAALGGSSAKAPAKAAAAKKKTASPPKSKAKAKAKTKATTTKKSAAAKRKA